MKTRIVGILSALALTFVAAPAFAAQYYVVMDHTAKKCIIMETMPTGANMEVLADAGNAGEKFYKTKPDADAAMGKMVVCKPM